MKPLLHLIVPLVLLGGVSAQDMVAVAWSGEIYALDSRTAALAKLGDGQFGQNAAAMDATGTFWSTSRTGASPSWVYSLTKVDPKSGMATLVHKGIPDVRALARGEPGRLWCVVNGNPDSLYTIDTRTGQLQRIGSTGVRGLTGLAMHQGKLFAWNLSIGLMTLDRATGKATRVGTSTGSGGCEIQFLASRSDGMLVGGKKELYEIDPITGSSRLVGKMPMMMDLRGAEEWYGNWSAFGKGCAGMHGAVSLSVSGKLEAGGNLVTTSDNHAASSVGVLILGASRTKYASLDLPFVVDRIFGTVGCSLYVSFDIVVPAMAEAKTPANMVVQLGLPAMASGMDVHAQHLVLEAVPGGTSWSNGATVHIGYQTP